MASSIWSISTECNFGWIAMAPNSGAPGRANLLPKRRPLTSWGPFWGLLLRFRGVTCLHASAVAIGGSVIAFVGAEGAGKSTTAAAFARAGYAAVSDDVVALVERKGDFFVSPSYPHLCLWPESVEMLYGRPMLFLLSFQIGKNAAFLLQMAALASRMAPCLFARFISWMRFAMSQVPRWKASPGRRAFSHSSRIVSRQICWTPKCARMNSKPFRAWLRRSHCDAYSQAKARLRPPIYARQCSMTSAPQPPHLDSSFIHPPA